MNIDLNIIGNESETFMALRDELIDLGHIIYTRRNPRSKRNHEAEDILPDLSMIGINMSKIDKNSMNTIFNIEEYTPTLFISFSVTIQQGLDGGGRVSA